MKLFVHIGTNKTGSSFLQSTLTLNKEKLKQEGYFVPDSKWDEAMLKGIITPGNGHHLAKLLAERDADNYLLKYLEELKQSAQTEQLNAIILSNEVIVRLFSEKVILSAFEQACNKVGFTEIRCLIYMRNFFEHALSLYKHRAKYGKNNDYLKWFETDYETLRLLKPFTEHIESSSIVFDFVPYEKDSEKIIQRFSDWLGRRNTTLDSFNKPVNPSLTLNQIRWINLIGSKYEGIGPQLYNTLIKVENPEENQFLVAQFYDAAEQYFHQYNETLQVMHKKLSDNPNCNISQRPPMKNGVSSSHSNLLSISEYNQIEKVVHYFSKYYKINRTIYLMKYKGRRFFLKLIGKKKNNLDNSKFGGSLRY